MATRWRRSDGGNDDDDASSEAPPPPSSEPPSKRPRSYLMSRTAGEEIATRMKAYEIEAHAGAALDRTRPWLARIDGHKFSTFTKVFKGRGKPFDRRIHDAMTATAEDCLRHFPACAAFTFSDEITLVFDASSAEEEVMMFGGKIVKISSLLAGFVSVRFVRHLQAAAWDDATEGKMLERIRDPWVHFDARVHNVPTRAEGLENIVWRSLFDCQRNSILNMARSYFSAKTMHGVSNTKACAMLRAEGHPWSEMPLCYRYGSWIKKETYEKHAVNKKTGAAVIATRTRPATRAFRLEGGATDANVAMLFAKFWGPAEATPDPAAAVAGGGGGGAAR